MRRFAFLQRRLASFSAQYAKNGSPNEVLQLKSMESLGAPKGTEVKLKMLAAPINPSDLNMVEGTYGVKAAFPAVGGNEGVGIVSAVGENVKHLSIGDLAIPFEAGVGTWRSELISDSSKWIKVSKDLPIPYAATLGVNPCTAYRLLKDFVDLQPGDVIIQNGANSMVGLAVIQMAREMGVKTINVIRSDRPDADKLNKLLTNLGGDINISDEYLNSYGFKQILKDLPPIKLAFNCVGGDCATNIARSLGTRGTMVTYGGMSKRPLTIPFDLLTSKQLSLVGFWMAGWNSTHSLADKQPMIDYVTDLIVKEKLTFFFDMIDFDDFSYAMKVNSKPYNFRKVVLNLDFPDRFAVHDQKTADDYWHFEAPVV